MKFQKITGQSIRIVCYLSQHPNEIIPSKTLSEQLDISYQICIKISNMLKKGGLINTTRGIYGGFQLTKTPKKISLYDIVVLIEGPVCIYGDLETVRPKKRGAQKSKDLFSVEPIFNNLQNMIVQELKNTTIESIINRKD